MFFVFAFLYSTFAKPMTENLHIQLTQKQHIAVDEISFLQANINYTILFLYSGKQVLAATTLKKFEYMLPKTTFIRPSKSFIIHRDFIEDINFRNKVIILKDTTIVPISRRRIPDLQVIWKKQKALLQNE